ncbi:MAG: hypothetical protein LBH52_01270 [Puniceicoccales bacterium]|jgi:hypothetical protein|nr:hypothetical protein [Puniceicoccales bacterium]
MAIAPSSFIPRSTACENLQLLALWDGDLFEKANSFLSKFSKQKAKNIIDMLTLPEDIKVPTCPMTSQPYAGIVSPARVLDIISNVARFGCGVQQLVDLAELCTRNKFHLCFVQCSRYI